MKNVLGGVAQLGEHHVRNVGVKGSNPSVSIINGIPFFFLRKNKEKQGRSTFVPDYAVSRGDFISG